MSAAAQGSTEWEIGSRLVSPTREVLGSCFIPDSSLGVEGDWGENIACEIAAAAVAVSDRGSAGTLRDVLEQHGAVVVCGL
jgi:hypothetical protein